MNVMGYIPVLGIIPGLIRIYDASTVDLLHEEGEARLAHRVLYFTRGVLEALGFGILCLIPDLIVSINRHFRSEPPVLAFTKVSSM